MLYIYLNLPVSNLGGYVIVCRFFVSQIRGALQGSGHRWKVGHSSLFAGGLWRDNKPITQSSIIPCGSGDTILLPCDYLDMSGGEATSSIQRSSFTSPWKDHCVRLDALCLHGIFLRRDFLVNESLGRFLTTASSLSFTFTLGQLAIV